MNDLPCLKIDRISVLIKKMEKIKIIIKDCLIDRNQRIEEIYNKEINTRVNEEEKKKQLEEMDKRITLTKKKYILLHNKLYDVIEILLSCKCCSDNGMKCMKESCCLNEKDNKKVYDIIDDLFNKIQDFYDEVETNLVIETEICFHKLNKIKRIDFFSLKKNPKL